LPDEDFFYIHLGFDYKGARIRAPLDMLGFSIFLAKGKKEKEAHVVLIYAGQTLRILANEYLQTPT
jgi:hypothetical protein